MADQPWIFLYYPETLQLVKPYVKGFPTLPARASLFYGDISIEK